MKACVNLYQVKADIPSIQDNRGDLDRLRKALSVKFSGRMPIIPFELLAHVARGFRESGFSGTAVINDLPHGPELIEFLPTPPIVLPGMALDLGTTHLEASLIDLITGKVLAVSDRLNSQLDYGADILERIHFATRNDGLDLLHRAVIQSLNDLAAQLCETAFISPTEIRALSVSGNTTMIHLFLKLNPYHICREPYIPMINAPDPCPAYKLGLNIHPGARAWILPSVGSYFGGDLISGILACNLDQKEKICMLIDVGTNAEVVIGNSEWFIACAGAAGPALEGGVARMGMRAGKGAIEHVKIDPETGSIKYTTIDNSPPMGICGSGIIDLVAGLYLSRMIDVRGKFRPARASGRLIRDKDGPAFVVAPAEETVDGIPVLLSQIDLDALIRSKAAMYSILTTIINQVSIKFKDLETIFVAGAFGRHIDPRQAVVLGMLPDLPLKTYVPVGNSSLKGAEKILLNASARDRCHKIAKKITYIELNVNQEFMIRFSGSRFIPHTDHTLFPSVPFFTDD